MCLTHVCLHVQAAAELLEEMCHLTAQSLTAMDTSEHFQLLKPLGEGSYGKVTLAVHRKRGTEVQMLLNPQNREKDEWRSFSAGTPMALKFFPRKSTSLFSFLREYNVSLSFCTHPSLTRALGIVYFTPSHYVFAQQASLFGDLYDVILPEVQTHFSSKVTWREEFFMTWTLWVLQLGMEEDCCQRVVSQLCGGLSHLHSLGFVHRDLKPENVFLCDSACRWVKLGDFGMVRTKTFFT